MQQLNLFENIEYVKPISKSVGRPPKVSPDLVLKVVTDINKNKSNQQIINNHDVSQRTFYRIKKGEYNHLLQKALEKTVEEFSLELTD
ncbi:hypothetical protein AB9G23_09585 [Francisella philomiragia]|uniref:hypothetical protein n=1 Tax=Francisella philomiragia TaxID=28110 RepID=UPI001907EFA1|nr:hypothetical protein [Francisella philomiragia]MBK2026189.1 hypothetical protein [Francisella philomiragia]